MPITASPPQNAAATRRASSTATLRDLVIYAFYYRRIIGVIMAVAVVLGAVGWMASPVRFTAQLQMLLLPGSDTINPLGAALPGIANAGRDVSSEVEFLHNRSLLAKVVEIVGPSRINPRLGDRRWFGLLPPIKTEEQVNNAIDIVARWLKVTTPTDTNLLLVSFQHEDRDTAIKLVDTLADVYLQRRSELYRSLKSPFLREKAQSFAKQLESLEGEIREVKAKDNILDLNQEILLALNQVDAGVQRRRSESERRAGLLAEADATRKKLNDVPQRVFDYEEKTDRVDNDDTDNLLVKLYLEQNRLKQLYQDDDPALADINRQIDTLQWVKRQPRREFSVSRTVRNPTVDFLNNHLTQVLVESDAVTKVLDELSNQIAVSQQRVDQLRDAESTLHALERSRAVTDQLYREFSQRAEAAQVEEAAAALKTSNIRIIANADASLEGSSNGFNLALAIIAAGILLALASALVADWNRQVFLLPPEVEQSVNLPILATFNEGQLPMVPGGSVGPIIFLAGQLGFNRTQSGTLQRLQIVSQGRQEHRQEFAAALATELAVGQNMRTLLLDLADDGTGHWKEMKQPKPHSTIGGFGIAPSGLPKLDISVGAPGGDINWSRANKEILDTLFSRLSENFDMIVIDSPSLRDSTVAVRLSPMVDGTILTVRAEQTRRAVLESIVSQLLGAGGDLYGGVFTDRKFYIPRIIYRWL